MIRKKGISNRKIVDTPFGKFDSNREYQVFLKYQFLLDNKIPDDNGEIITSIDRQVKIIVELNGQKLFSYKCDIVLNYSSTNKRWIDVKGYTHLKSNGKYVKNTEFRLFELKAKIIKNLYSIEIEVVK